MITEIQKQKLKKVLGRRYAPDIVEVLKEKDIKKSNGQEYSEAYVRQVFNGRFDNVEVTNVIYEVYKVKKRLIDRIQKKIDKM